MKKTSSIRKHKRLLSPQEQKSLRRKPRKTGRRNSSPAEAATRRGPGQALAGPSAGEYGPLFLNINECVVIFEAVRRNDSLTLDWIARDINSTGVKTFDISPEELPGKGVSEIIGDPLDSDLGIFRSTMASGKAARFETYVSRKDKYYLNSAFPMGQDLYGIASVDITDRKKAEHALHENEERMARQRTAEMTKAFELLERVFSSINVHIAYLDRDYHFISVNRAYAAAQEKSPDFFTGKNYFDLFTHEENKALFRSVIETGNPFVAYEKPFTDSGKPVQGVTYWDWSLQPVKDVDGGVSGLVLSSVNVTDRKRAEEINLRLAAAIDSAADAVVISDSRGIIQYVNPAFEKITGYGRKEALGGDQHMLDGGKHDEPFFRELRQTVQRNGFWKGRLINKKKDGTMYNEECTYSPIKNQAGDIINYVSIKRDVTEKLWLESIAQSVDTMNNIGYIFAGVRHEIGNPVNAVNMILEVLRSKLHQLEKPAIEGYLDRALTQLSRISYLLRTLKTYNMYEKPQLQNMVMSDFMEKFLTVVREDFRTKGIAMTVSVAPDAASCHADPRALQQILLNFLTNSADALQDRENPTIAMSVFRKGSMVRIRVEDNGCGMTGEEQKALFKPFYTTKAKGTGLGLVIVKKMLTMMKGTIEITSRKNSGTIVEVALPDGTQKENEHLLSARGYGA